MAYNIHKIWTPEEETLLKTLGKSDTPLREVCRQLKRTEMAIILHTRNIAGIENNSEKEVWHERIIDQTKTYSQLYQNRGSRWGAGDDANLKTKFSNGESIYQIANQMGKSPTAIIERLKLLYNTPAKMEQLWQENKRWLRFRPLSAINNSNI